MTAIEVMKARRVELLATLDEPISKERAEAIIDELMALDAHLNLNEGEPMTDAPAALPHVTPVTYAEAQRITKRCKCAACWSHLIIFDYKPDRKFVTALCPNCKEQTPGYVSVRYVERRQNESRAEAAEAKRNLKDALPFLNPHAQKQTADILAEIGF